MLGWQQPDELSPTLSSMMEQVIADKPISPQEGIPHHKEGMDLMPANIELSGLEVSLVNTMSREMVTSEHLTSLMAELDEDNEKVEVLKIHTWSQIFDESDLDTKKMIANYMIKRITVFECYKLDIELDMHVQQFLNGLENAENEHAAS